jgi:hypothetical protein
MLVSSYDYAHKMVETNKFLSWNGWDIVEFKPNDSAEYKAEGSLQNGLWGFAKTFPLTEKGWEVPSKYVRA